MNKKYQTEKHLENVRSKILESAKELFVQQGYKKTTIRQIVEKSGVLTGSIYYLYKNKEDIFKALVLSLIKQCSDLINKHFVEESPAFKYAALCTIELRAVEVNELIRESYYDGYTSNAIFEKMVEHMTQMSEQNFADLFSGWSHEDYYIRTLLIKSAMRGCIAEFYFEKQGDAAKCRKMLLRLALSTFQVKENEIAGILGRIEAMDAHWLEIVDRLCQQSMRLKK